MGGLRSRGKKKLSTTTGVVLRRFGAREATKKSKEPQERGTGKHHDRMRRQKWRVRNGGKKSEKKKENNNGRWKI